MAFTKVAAGFWSSLFEQEQLALRLDQVAAEPGGLSIDLADCGRIQVKAVRATALGDNFMSDAYSVTAKLENDNQTEYNAFVKVVISGSSNIYFRLIFCNNYRLYRTIRS